MLFAKIVSLLLLIILGTSFIGATANCLKKGQYGGFGLGFMLSFIILVFTVKILIMLFGG